MIHSIALSLQLNVMMIFGITLLLGVIGGEIAKRLAFLPQISGYIFMGFIVGPGGFDILNHSILSISHLFVDISLSLVLFELGRQLDFTWLKHDKGLLYISLVESALTFILTFSVLSFFLNLSHIKAALAATIAIATSPAVVMMVINDLSSEGPVTRRALILTSLNNMFALLLFTLLLPLAQKTQSSLVLQTSYTLLGSIGFGLIIFGLAKSIAIFIGKQKENQFVLIIGAVVLTIGIAYVLKLSTLIALFTLGVAARNLDFNHSLIEIDFGWLARLFFILLFVMIGAHIHLDQLKQAPLVVLVFLLTRIFAKFFSSFIFYKKCRLTFRQAYALSLTLFPMAGLAIGMSNIMIHTDPDLGNSLETIISAIIAILNIIGPIFVQHAFIVTKEGLNNQEQV